MHIWAATWQNQQNDCKRSEVSDQPSLIRVLLSAWRKLESLATHWAQWWRLWSDWADTQADLSLRWMHSHFVVLSCRGSYTLLSRRGRMAVEIILWSDSPGKLCGHEGWCSTVVRLATDVNQSIYILMINQTVSIALSYMQVTNFSTLMRNLKWQLVIYNLQV